MLAATLLLVPACAPTAANYPPRNNAAPGVNKPGPAKADGDAATMPLEPQNVEYVAFDGGLKVYPALKRVELGAQLIGGQSRPLEFFLVGSGGATHESLFSTAAGAEHLKRALELIGLKEGWVKRQGRGYLEDPVGDRVKISIRFKHAGSGETKVVRAEDWLINSITGQSPETVGFIFTGGQEEFAADQNRQVLSADQLGNYIAVWHDSSCILDNDRKHGAISDCYTPNPDAPGMPAAGAEVTLVFEAHP